MLTVSAAEDWENPAKFAEGRLPHRATAYPYPTAAEALKGDFKASIWYESLNGKWKFNYSAKPSERPKDFILPVMTFHPGATSTCLATGRCRDTERRSM